MDINNILKEEFSLKDFQVVNTIELIDEMTIQTLLSGEYDKNNALVSINACTG